MNERQCYFVEKENCDLDVEERKCVVYKPFGSEIRYVSYSFCLPPEAPEEEILHFMLVYEQPDRRFE